MHDDSKHPDSKPDPAVAALASYDALRAASNVAAVEWRRVAIALWAASHALTGDRQRFVRDRANDAHNRADAARTRPRR